MSKTALILVDFQADNVAQDDVPLKRLKQGYPKLDLTLASRRYGVKEQKDSKTNKLSPYVSKLADAVVSKDGISPSAFEGGTLRPIEATERLLKRADVEVVVIGGYFLEWAVAQTAFDANALGYQTKVDLSITAREKPSDYDVARVCQRLEQAGIQLIVWEPAILDDIHVSVSVP